MLYVNVVLLWKSRICQIYIRVWFVCVCKYVRSYSGVRHLSFVMFGTHPCSATLTATASTAPSANRNATLAHILKSVPSTVYLLNKASMELTREFVPIRRRLEIYRGRPRSPYRSFARALTFSSLHLLRHSVIRSLLACVQIRRRARQTCSVW